MKNFKNWAFIASIVVSIISCNNDEPNDVSPVLTLKFDHSVKIGETVYDASQNQVTINKLRYLITDVTLVKSDDTEVALSNDIAATMIDLSEAEDGVVYKYLKNVPTGNFTSVKFKIGVSETIYNQGEQAQGILLSLAQTKESDDSNMFWAWASGYIYLKLEGTTSRHQGEGETSNGHVHAINTTNLPVAFQDTPTATSFISHIGNTGAGQTRTDRVMQVSIDFHGETVNFKNVDTSIHLAVNVEKMLTGTSGVDVTTFESLHSFSDAIKVNVEKDVFSFHHKH